MHDEQGIPAFQFEELDITAFIELRRLLGFGEHTYRSLMREENFEPITDTHSKGGQHIIRLKSGGVIFKTLVSSFLSAF